MLYDQEGDLIPQGRVRKELVEPFFGAALPGWLTSDAGVVSFMDSTEAEGSVRVTTDGTLNAVARLKTSFGIATTNFAAVMFTVEGFAIDDVSATIALKLAGVNCGVGLQHNGNVTEARVRTYRPSTFTEALTHIALRQIGVRRQNVSLLLLPDTKQVYVLSDDQVIAYQNVTSMQYTGGTITPSIEIVASGTPASARYMQIEQIRLTTWSN